MQAPDGKITGFLRKHHVLTLATLAGNQPWVAHCFYAFMEDEMALVFTSGTETRHIREATANHLVAGSVVLETSVVGKIQGVQFTGVLETPDGDMKDKVTAAYLKRFPFAALMDTTLWIFRIRSLKMTDNRLGFGKKLYWEKEMRTEK